MPLHSWHQLSSQHQDIFVHQVQHSCNQLLDLRSRLCACACPCSPQIGRLGGGWIFCPYPPSYDMVEVLNNVIQYNLMYFKTIQDKFMESHGNYNCLYLSSFIYWTTCFVFNVFISNIPQKCLFNDTINNREWKLINIIIHLSYLQFLVSLISIHQVKTNILGSTYH